MFATLAPLVIALITFGIEWLRKRNSITEQEYQQTMGAMNEALNRAKAAKRIDSNAGELSDDWLSRPKGKDSTNSGSGEGGDK